DRRHRCVRRRPRVRRPRVSGRLRGRVHRRAGRSPQGKPIRRAPRGGGRGRSVGARGGAGRRQGKSRGKAGRTGSREENSPYGFFLSGWPGLFRLVSPPLGGVFPEHQPRKARYPPIVTVFRETLLLPGPTEIPVPVQQAMSRGADYHRGPEFGLAFKECLTLLQQLMGTQEDVVVLPGTGRSGVEAAIVNVLNPGERVLAVCNGVFGDMMARIAEGYGARVVRIEGEWGRAVPP